MKAILLAVTLVLAVVAGENIYDLPKEIGNALSRFKNDFLLGVWYRANEAIVESTEKLLNLYTHYTLKQSEQVIENIAKYTNYTQVESAEQRDKALATKDTIKIMELTDCIFKYETATIEAYKMTGYNLHNCIRMSQIDTETKYRQVIKNFDNIKNISIDFHNYFGKSVSNCVDKMCVIAVLIRSVVEYERLQEYISTNVTEINSVNMKYLLQQIALDCVSKSIFQIEENYNIGKGLVNNCFLPKNQTTQTGPIEPENALNETSSNDN